MIRKRCSRGQSLVELGILFAIVVGALMVMKTYVQRGMQGRLKKATDYKLTMDNENFGGEFQYEPQYQTGAVTTNATGSETRGAVKGGDVTVAAGDASFRTGNEEVSGLGDANYGGEEEGNGE